VTAPGTPRCSETPWRSHDITPIEQQGAYSVHCLRYTRFLSAGSKYNSEYICKCHFRCSGSISIIKQQIVLSNHQLLTTTTQLFQQNTMGLFGLAVVGGGAYFLAKKHHEAKQRRMEGGYTGGRCGPQQQQPVNRSVPVEDFHGDFNTVQQYYNPSEKQLPSYRDRPEMANAYTNEKGGMQQSVQEVKH
jgi:hypothetical protein